MPVRLFVGNLPYDATEEDIRAHFSTAGNVVNVFVPLDRETGRKRGFAFVEFNDGAEAQEAIRLFNSQPFKGRPLAVNEARAKESRPPTPGGGGGFRPGPRPPSTGGFRPSGPPSGPSGGPPRRDFDRPDPSALDPRADKHARKFGPDAKPFKNRNQKSFRPEGGKKALKERMSGQVYSMDDEGETINEPEIDNFAQGLEEDSKENS
ncbi:MAG TPA: RNA-binding protein [Terriglobia bacterium]|nr:RNA-binding protein [Terriglobia bacterium]